MGNCCGSFRHSRKAKAQRLEGWARTGIVALRDEKLKELPLSVLELGSKVTTLDATNNGLRDLPDSIVDLTSLQRLKLAKNALVEIPSSVGQLSQIKVLVLDFNQLSILPDSIGDLSRLEQLSVTSNNLSNLPDTLGKLTSLKQLHIARNKLHSLPEALGGCSSLEEIEATDNYLEEVPEALGKLKKLRMLGLDNNRVASVPPGILVNCVSLQTLSLHSNPITPEVLESTEGWREFEKRRQTKTNKAIAGGAMLGQSAMDQGVDRRTNQS